MTRYIQKEKDMPPCILFMILIVEELPEERQTIDVVIVLNDCLVTKLNTSVFFH